MNTTESPTSRFDQEVQRVITQHLRSSIEETWRHMPGFLAAVEACRQGEVSFGLLLEADACDETAAEWITLSAFLMNLADSIESLGPIEEIERVDAELLGRARQMARETASR